MTVQAELARDRRRATSTADPSGTEKPAALVGGATPAPARRSRDRQVVPMPVGRTPVLTVHLTVKGVSRALRLKLESFNPCGSSKDRTALALLDRVADRVHPSAGVIESTSGNLGVAMAAVTAAAGFRFTAVVDPRTSDTLLRRLRHLGARVLMIDEPDGAGGYLLRRLERVRHELARDPRLVWTNQYQSSANPAAHANSTAPETRAQVPATEAVFVAVSTGGTAAGFLDYAERHRVPWDVVGVDVPGSAALTGVPGPRILPGIGAGQRSSFLAGRAMDAEIVSADEAVGACLWLDRVAEVGLGGSAGAVVAAALRRMRADPELRDVVCLCPDGADRYLTTLYSARWRDRYGLRPVQVPPDVDVRR